MDEVDKILADLDKSQAHISGSNSPSTDKQGGIVASGNSGVTKPTPVSNSAQSSDRDEVEQILQRYEAELPKRSVWENIKRAKQRGVDEIALSSNLWDASKKAIDKGVDVTTLPEWKAVTDLFEQEQYDPLPGGVGGSILYGGTKALSGMAKGLWEGKEEAAVGAAIGAGVGYVVSRLDKIPGDEVALPSVLRKVGSKLGDWGFATISGGLGKGAKLGLMSGSARYWYKQGGGEMLYQMVNLGIDPKIARGVAGVAAVPYAAIDYLEVGTLTKSLRAGLAREAAAGALDALKKAGIQYVGTNAAEVTQEVMQQMVEDSAVRMAGYLSAHGKPVNWDKFPQYVEDAKQTIEQAGIAFILPSAIGPVTGMAAGKMRGGKAVSTTSPEVDKGVEIRKDAKKIEYSTAVVDKESDNLREHTKEQFQHTLAHGLAEQASIDRLRAIAEQLLKAGKDEIANIMLRRVEILQENQLLHSTPEEDAFTNEILQKISDEGKNPSSRATTPKKGLVTPTVARLAESLGINPQLVHGSGPGGGVTSADVKYTAQVMGRIPIPSPQQDMEQRQQRDAQVMAAVRELKNENQVVVSEATKQAIASHPDVAMQAMEEAPPPGSEAAHEPPAKNVPTGMRVIPLEVSAPDGTFIRIPSDLISNLPEDTSIDMADPSEFTKTMRRLSVFLRRQGYTGMLVESILRDEEPEVILFEGNLEEESRRVGYTGQVEQALREKFDELQKRPYVLDVYPSGDNFLDVGYAWSPSPRYFLTMMRELASKLLANKEIKGIDFIPASTWTRGIISKLQDKGVPVETHGISQNISRADFLEHFRKDVVDTPIRYGEIHDRLSLAEFVERQKTVIASNFPEYGDLREQAFGIRYFTDPNQVGIGGRLTSSRTGQPIINISVGRPATPAEFAQLIHTQVGRRGVIGHSAMPEMYGSPTGKWTITSLKEFVSTDQAAIRRVVTEEILHGTDKWMGLGHVEGFDSEVAMITNGEYWDRVLSSTLPEGVERRAIEANAVLHAPPDVRALPANTSTSRLAIMDRANKIVGKQVSSLFSAVKNLIPRKLRRAITQPFQESQDIEAVYGSYHSSQARGTMDIAGFLELLSTNKTTQDEKEMLWMFASGVDPATIEGIKGSAIPEWLLDTSRQGRERARAIGQALGRQAASLGLTVRKDELYGEKYWVPTKWTDKEITSIAGKLFSRGKRQLGVNKSEASHGKQKSSDRYVVFMNKERVKGAVFRTEEQANAYADRLRNDHPRSKIDVVAPMSPEQKVAEGWILSPRYNILSYQEEYGRNNKIQFFTDIANLGENTLKWNPEPGWVHFASTGLDRDIVRAYGGENNLAKNNGALYKMITKGYIPEDLAYDLAGTFGPESWISALVKNPVERSLRAMVTFLNPERVVYKQFAENELTLFMADSRAFASKDRISALAKYLRILLPGGTPEGQIWDEAIDLGIPAETFVGAMFNTKQLATKEQGKLVEMGKSFIEKAKRTYGAEDLAYKMAIYEYYRVTRGMTQLEAYDRMESATFNWRDMPPLVQKMRFIPFIPGVVYNFSRIISQQLQRNPVSFSLKLALLTIGFQELQSHMKKHFGMDDEDIRKLGRFAPSWAQVPLWRGPDGRLVYLDLRWLVPYYGTFNPGSFDPDQEASVALGLLPMSVRGVAASLFGKDQYGNPLWKGTDSDKLKRLKQLRVLAESYAPQWFGQKWITAFRNAKRTPEQKRPLWDIAFGGVATRNEAQMARYSKGAQRGALMDLRRKMYGLTHTPMTEMQRRAAMADLRRRMEEIRRGNL